MAKDRSEYPLRLDVSQSELSSIEQLRLNLGAVSHKLGALHSAGNPHPHSDFAADHRRSKAYPTHLTVMHQLIAAGENLQSLGDMLRADKEADGGLRIGGRVAGPYACVRAAIECAANAYWLAAPKSSDERLTRSFVWQREDTHLRWKAINEFRKLFPEDQGADSRDSHRSLPDDNRHLDEFAERAGLDIKATQRRVSMTDILEWIKENNEHLSTSKGLWMLTSGQAHGRLWSHLHIAQMTEVSRDPVNESSHFVHALNYTTLNDMVTGTLLLFNEANAMSWKRWRAPGAGASFFPSPGS